MRGERGPKFDQEFWKDRKFGNNDVFVDLPYVEHSPFAAVDKETIQLIQVEDLHKAVDRTTTRLGSAVLFESLVHPPTDHSLILAKQQAVAELRRDPLLRRSVQDYLEKFKKREDTLLEFLNEGIPFEPPFGAPYRGLKKVKKSWKNAVVAADNILPSDSSYVQTMIEQIKEAENGSAYHLLQGPILRTKSGIKTKEEVDTLTPRWRLRRRRITGGTLAFSAPVIAQIMGVDFGHAPPGMVSFPDLLASIVPMYGVMYAGIMKPGLDDQTAIEPLRQQTLSSQSSLEMLHAVGKLDELMSFVALAEANPESTCMPVITDDPEHHFSATDLRNPVLVRDMPDFVPNNVDLREAKLTFLTGRNSGGKTTFCKSIEQNQLLGQIGGPVFATSATINIADKVAYQAPRFDALQDSEGRFGTELAQTRDIFYATTPKSLVVLDELAEGTTVEEKMEQSIDILDDFYTIGNNTVLVTHNHDLVDQFRDRERGQFLQVEFTDDETPTHRVIVGISRDSGARHVARRIGFSKDDRQRHLREKGYIQ
jgi:DNA mismatch repair protein MutS